MTFEEFEKAKKRHLKREAKQCFDKCSDESMTGDARTATLLEAQFYMGELDRKSSSRIALRDLLLEIVVILLIGAEIWMGSRQDNVLKNLQSAAASTAATLSSLQKTTESMNTAIQRQTSLLTEVSVEITYDVGQKRLNVANRGNANLELWGDRVDAGPRSIDKEPVIIARGGFYYMLAGRFYDEALQKVSPGSELLIPFEVYL